MLARSTSRIGDFVHAASPDTARAITTVVAVSCTRCDRAIDVATRSAPATRCGSIEFENRPARLSRMAAASTRPCATEPPETADAVPYSALVTPAVPARGYA